MAKISTARRTLEERVEKTENRVDDFIEDHAMKRELDIFAFAEQSERHDFNSNIAKASSVLITGITII